MADLSQSASLTIRVIDDGSSGGQGGTPPVPTVRPAGGGTQPVPTVRPVGGTQPTGTSPQTVRPAGPSGIVRASRALTSVFQGAGRAGQAFAANKTGAAAGAALSGAAPLIAAIPEVGIPLVAVGTAAVGLAKAFKDTTVALIERGRELARYSPQIAISEARADIRSIQQDIRESRALAGPESRLIDVWSELTIELREILLPIKKAVVEVITDLLELIRQILGDIRKPIAVMAEGIAALLVIAERLATFDKKGAIARAAEAIVRIAVILGDNQKKEQEPDFLSEFLRLGREGIPDFSKKPAPAPAEGVAQKLGAPLFGGLR